MIETVTCQCGKKTEVRFYTQCSDCGRPLRSSRDILEEIREQKILIISASTSIAILEVELAMRGFRYSPTPGKVILFEDFCKGVRKTPRGEKTQKNFYKRLEEAKEALERVSGTSD